MTLNEFHNQVARRVDTAKTKINAAEARRVVSEAFLVLSTLSSAEAADVVAKGLASAVKKSAKK
ncbi:MAG: hypothetical protein KDA37_16685 [Planctomycetales bacterium]|nr:hypothetical protein [Planctomycetales bacterium]